MTDWLNNADSTTRSIAVAAALLRHYTFDMAGQTIGQAIATWAQRYPVPWLRAAVIEALYQGRYKAISVQQILSIWQRRSRPLCHFNSEFERMVCSPIIDEHALDAFADALAAIIHVPRNAHIQRSSAASSTTQDTAPSKLPLPPTSPQDNDHLANGHLTNGQSHPDLADSSKPVRSPSPHRSIPPFSAVDHSALASLPTHEQEHGGDRIQETAPQRSLERFMPRDTDFYQRLRSLASHDDADSQASDFKYHSDLKHTASHPSEPPISKLDAARSPQCSSPSSPRMDDWVEIESDAAAAHSADQAQSYPESAQQIPSTAGHSHALSPKSSLDSSSAQSSFDSELQPSAAKRSESERSHTETHDAELHGKSHAESDAADDSPESDLESLTNSG